MRGVNSPLGISLISCICLAAIAHRRAQKPDDSGLAREAQPLAAVVGVFSGADPKYEERRALLRRTWFPDSAAKLAQLREEASIEMRFVVGKARSPVEQASLASEEAQFGQFFRTLTVVEGYHNLAIKILAFWRLALRDLLFRFILKVDDDVYLRPAQLPSAVTRWTGAEYVGCFRRHGRLHLSPRDKFFETGHQLLGRAYFAYATGSVYAVHSDAAALLSDMTTGALRLFGCGDDCSVAMWLIAFNASVLEDNELCRWECGRPDTVAVRHHGRCGGLCKPLNDIPLLHADPRCSGNQTEHSEPEASGGKRGRGKDPLWVPPCINVNHNSTDTIRLENCGGKRADDE